MCRRVLNTDQELGVADLEKGARPPKALNATALPLGPRAELGHQRIGGGGKLPTLAGLHPLESLRDLTSINTIQRV